MDESAIKGCYPLPESLANAACINKDISLRPEGKTAKPGDAEASDAAKLFEEIKGYLSRFARTTARGPFGALRPDKS